jgi:putative heme transporter
MAALASPEIRNKPSREQQDMTPDLTVDFRALARRAAPFAAFAAVAVAVLLVAGGPLQAFADALRRAASASPGWVAAAAAFEALSFAGYVLLLWLVGGRATRKIGLRESVHMTLGGAAATRLLPTAGVGGAALTLWALRRAGLPGRQATRTLFGFLVVLYSVFLISIAVSGGLITVGLAHAHGPLALSAVPAGAATLGIIAALTLGLRARRAAPGSGGRLSVVGEGVYDALRIVRSADPRLLGALAWWAFDAAVLWAMLNAFGTPPGPAVLVLAYFVGQVANTVPVPGAASGGLVGVLLAFGVDADLALVSVLAYRSVAIWLPAPAGLVALGGLKRTVARWRDDAPGRFDLVPQPA